MAAAHVLPSGENLKALENFGKDAKIWKLGEIGSWKELEVHKIHVLVNKNLTKMEFRRTTSK